MKYLLGILVVLAIAAAWLFFHGRGYAYESEMYHFCKNTLEKNLNDSRSLIVDEVILAPSSEKRVYTPPQPLKEAANLRPISTSVAIKYSAKNSFGAYRKEFTICEFKGDVKKKTGEYYQIEPVSIFVGNRKVTYSSKVDDMVAWYAATGTAGGTLNISAFAPFIAAYDLLVEKVNFLKPAAE